MNIQIHSSHRKEAGSALLITLAVLVILTIIIVGFSESVRVERVSARSHFDGTQATLLAQSGIDQAVAAIRETTADTGRNWISQPGRLIAGAATGGGEPDARKILQQEVPLSSGLATASTNPIFAAPDLNALTFQTPASHLVTESPDASGNVAQLKAQWIYVRKDGTLDTSATPSTTNTDNPLVGRYAYWTDDESSKVNYNVAWTRDDANPHSISHPTKVGLAALLSPNNLTVGEDMARAIHFYDVPGAPTSTFARRIRRAGTRGLRHPAKRPSSGVRQRRARRIFGRADHSEIQPHPLRQRSRDDVLQRRPFRFDDQRGPRGRAFLSGYSQ